MTEWVKRLQGYVKIRVWGFAPQRFINLCSNKGILLWNIEKQEDVYTMCIGLRSFYELRPIARKTKVRVVISERYGLPFFVPGMLRRKAFLAGLFLAVAFWLISSLFVWDIQVTGNYQVTDDVFYSFLEQEGIHTGMRRSELNIGELEKKIRRKFSQVTWTSGRLDGTRLVIEVKENDMSVPEVVQDAAGEGKDLVADVSSCFLSEPVDVSKYGLIFAGAQKNVGPAGTVIVIIREDLITEDVLPGTPTMLTYKTHADAGSLYNTPPAYGIYICGKVFKWIKKMGGLSAMKEHNEKKAKILYDFLDESRLFKGTVVKEDRSLMNVPFVTGDKELDAKFVEEATKAGFVNLKGHRTVGGMRASIYNAMPIEGVEKLVEFMKKFEKENTK